MAQDRIAEQVAGVVTCSNSKGFQLEGRDGWLNISKFAAGVAAPERGARVVAGLDKAGFVRTVELVEVSSAEAPPTEPRTSPDRETAITRMACLNTATAILSSGQRAIGDVAAVLGTAAQLERWINRRVDGSVYICSTADARRSESECADGPPLASEEPRRCAESLL